MALTTLGAAPELIKRTATAKTASEILTEAQVVGLPLGDYIAAQARAVARNLVCGRVAIEIVIFDRVGGLVGRAAF